MLYLGLSNAKQAQTGKCVAGEQFSRKGPEGDCQQKAQHEPMVCPGSQEGKMHFRVH